jgi:hypothetical protein
VGQYDGITGIAVSGTYLYLSGKSWLGGAPDQAFYFKNGLKIVLANGYAAYGIGVNGSDVYCAGRDMSNNAVYWKNTDIHILGPAGIAFCILVEKQ